MMGEERKEEAEDEIVVEGTLEELKEIAEIMFATEVFKNLNNAERKKGEEKHDK